MSVCMVFPSSMLIYFHWPVSKYSTVVQDPLKLYSIPFTLDSDLPLEAVFTTNVKEHKSFLWSTQAV